MAAGPALPTVDLAPFLNSNTVVERKAAATTLAEALHIYGAVGIIGWETLVPDAKLQDAFKVAKSMFDLPMEDKLKAPHPDGFVPHRGYSKPGQEKAYNKDELSTDSKDVKESLRKITDYKEHYEIGSEENKVHYNIWLPEEVLPGYRQYETDLFWFLHNVSTVFMDALLLGLDVDEADATAFKALHGGHDSILRLLHYPPIEENGIDREYLARCPAHQDLTTFTILFQDSAGGLEFADPAQKDSFIPAVPAPGKLYLNTGDMFEIFSNGYYPSAMHRVGIPRSSTASADATGTTVAAAAKEGLFTPGRQSMPFFIIPENDAVISPAQSGIPAQRPMTEKLSARSWNEQAAFITKWQYEKEG